LVSLLLLLFWGIEYCVWFSFQPSFRYIETFVAIAIAVVVVVFFFGKKNLIFPISSGIVCNITENQSKPT
jgi:predicted exporter